MKDAPSFTGCSRATCNIMQPVGLLPYQLGIHAVYHCGGGQVVGFRLDVGAIPCLSKSEMQYMTFCRVPEAFPGKPQESRSFCGFPFETTRLLSLERDTSPSSEFWATHWRLGVQTRGREGLCCVGCA